MKTFSTSSKVPFPNPSSSKRATNFLAFSFEPVAVLLQLLALDLALDGVEDLDHPVEPVERQRLDGRRDLLLAEPLLGGVEGLDESATSEARCFSFTPSFVRWLKIEPDDVVEDGLGLVERERDLHAVEDLGLERRSLPSSSGPCTFSRASLMFSSLGMKSLPANSSNPQV